MSAIKTEHSGAKNGGGFYGPRADAKDVSNKLRREDAKTLVRASKVTYDPINPLATFVSGDFAQIGSSGNSAQIGSSGNSAQIGSSGNSAQIGSSGNSAQIGSSGDSARIGSSGDFARIGSSGDSARIGSSGDFARIGSSGDFAQIVASGKNAVIACAARATVTAGERGAFCIPYHDGKRTRFAVGYVGEHGIKAGVAYRADANGKLVEVA